MDGAHGRDMHRRGEGVVRALRHIDRVVRVQQRFADDRVAAVCDDLVDVHIRLGAAARLPDGEREFPVQSAAEDLVADLGDQRAAPLIQLSEIAVCQRRSFFQHGEGADDLDRHAVVSDRKILQAALRLRAPQPVGRDLHFTERVMFNPIFHSENLLKKWYGTSFLSVPYHSFCFRASVPRTISRQGSGPG